MKQYDWILPHKVQEEIGLRLFLLYITMGLREESLAPPNNRLIGVSMRLILLLKREKAT